MHKFYRLMYLFVLVVLILMATDTSWAQVRGKIAGTILHMDSNEPVAGANIIVEGTNLGAATDEDGFFFIINIPPGVYVVKAIMVGYGTIVQENVEVSSNRTTTLDFKMQTEVLAGETVTIIAERPVVQLDVSSSQRVINEEAILSRPLENFEEVLSNEVGITLSASANGTGLIVRGGGLNETDIAVDGLSTRNQRTQQPMTNLSLTAIKEVEILTGGFNAEYGDIRSGMINVVTKEGSLDRYSGTVDGRYSPSARKHFGPSPYSIDGPFWQVYTGKDAFTGIDQTMVDNGQYPFTFIGWNKVGKQFLEDTDANNDMTPQELLELWKWQHRQIKYAEDPDYILDFSLSGPIPYTPVAFMFSQRYENLQLVYPFSRKNSIASTTLLKLTTNLSPTMKLSFNNSFMLIRGVSGSIYDDTNGLITGSREGTQYAQDAFYYRYIWHDANYNPAETQLYRGGIFLNHVLSSSTYYDLKLEYTTSKTVQEPIGLRNTSPIKKIGDKWYDEQPFGYVGSEIGNITEKYDILGDFLMSGGGRGQDHSKYWGVSFSGDLVMQINKNNQIKTGLRFDYTSFEERREINHGATTTPWEIDPSNWWYYDETPVKLGLYIQDKLEYAGMIANIGLRADYLKPGNELYNIDPNFIFTNNPYTLANFRAGDNSFNQYTLDEPGYKLYWSPRLGVSHPVTETSKIFFNYGHFYQPPVNDQLYTVKPYSRSATVPNVGAEWPKTIAYEIGYEHSLGADYLIHLMGYYKDISNELSEQNIVSLDEENNVSTYANNSYADIRGIELRLEKRVGRWIYGWASFEYMVRSTGYTGLRYVYEDRQKANEERETTVQDRGWPIPSLMANITFQTPADWGPLFIGDHVLGDWHFNIIQQWSDGGKSLLNPESKLSEQIYVDVIDWWNTDIMLEKRISSSMGRISLFMQVKNLFNYKGFPNPLYWNKYVDSLKFPHEKGAQKGNDKLGDSGKDYIELGWNTWSQFVNPRDIFFGLRIQF